MRKRIVLFALALICAVSLVACGKGNKNNSAKEKTITIWVGTECVEFYKTELEQYAADYKTTNGKDYPYTINVLGVDAGAAAAKFLDDTDAGAEIFTIPHDNLGKLTAGSSSIANINDEALLAQIRNDNSDNFVKVTQNTVMGKSYFFGVPYVAQSLVLYYNKALLNEEAVKTWEGIWDVAKEKKKQSVSLLGDDGFNASFVLLSTRVSDGSTSLKIYQDGTIEDCYTTGDDTVATTKWAQRFFTDPNGAKFPSSAGWESELSGNKSLALIGGAWNFKAAKAALGSNLGIAVLPTFTLTEADAYGTAVAGTEYHSGTFADVKMLVLKKGLSTEKRAECQKIMKFMSSKEEQQKAFLAVNNLPSYKNAVAEFPEMNITDTENANYNASLLGKLQIQMFEYGIPQPFGPAQKYNLYFYSKGAPSIIKAIYNGDEGYKTEAEIITALGQVQKIWVTGSKD